MPRKRTLTIWLVSCWKRLDADIAKSHDYQFCFVSRGIDHSKTKAKSPQTNGICERLHKTILDEFFKVAFRKKLYADLESLKQDPGRLAGVLHAQRTHRGKMCCGRTPLARLEDGTRLWKEKFVG